jgi:hypothetical protein
MLTYKTSTCGHHGHPEFTVQFDQPCVPGGEQLLLSWFEDAVAEGTRFAAGNTLGMGGHSLRLVARPDGTLGVEEPVPSPEPRWVERIDRTVREVITQRYICDSVGLALTCPPPGSHCLVTDCSEHAQTLVLNRVVAPPDLPGFSGWLVSCAEEHDHSERSQLPLLALSALRPFSVQFLALPPESTVLLVPPGHGHVFFEGEELTPKAGSYLEGLNARK